MIDVKKSFFHFHSIASRDAIVPSNLIFSILSSMIVIISSALYACAPKQMTLDEARQTSITMRGKFFSPSPRSIDGILDMLDKQKARYVPDSKKLHDKIKCDAPADASKSELSKFYFERGVAANILGYFNQALSDYQRAYELATAEAFGTVDVKIINHLASTEMFFGNYDRAIALLKKTNESIGSYYHLLQIYSEVGDFDEAAKIHTKAISYFHKNFSSFSWTSKLFKAKLEYTYLRALGRFREAEEFHYEALRQASFGQPDRPDYLIYEKRALAWNLLFQGRLVEAEIMAREAIEDSIRLLGVESGLLVGNLQLLAEVFHDQGRLTHAEEIIKATLQIHENLGITSESRYYRNTKSTLGRVLTAAGDYHGAAEQYEFFREKEVSNKYIYKLFLAQDIDFMISFIMCGRSEEVIALIEDSYHKSQTFFGEHNFHTALFLAVRGMALSKLSELDSAYADFTAAIPIVIKQMENSDSFVYGYRARIIVESYLDLLSKVKGSALEKLLRIDSTVEAFEIADLLRDQTVQSSVLASSARIQTEDQNLAELVRSEQDVRQQIKAYQSLIQNMFSKLSIGQYEQNIDKVKVIIEKLSNARDVIQDEIRSRFPGYADMIRPRRKGLAEVQRQIRTDEVIISIYSTQTNTFVWAVPNKGASVMTIVNVSKSDFESMVFELKKSLFPLSDTLGQLPAYDFQKAYELYSLLLKPSEILWKKTKDIFLLTSYPMNQIPIAVLLTRPFQPEPEKAELFSNYRDAPWLIRTCSITTVPSLSSFVSLRSLTTAPQVRKAFAGFGDPYFNKNQMVKALTEDRGLNIAHQDNDYKLSVRGIRLTKDGSLDRKNILSCNIENLSRLPDTAQEIESIAAVLGANSEQDVYLGRRASEKQVKTMNLSDRRVIAFASHALVPYDLDGLDQPAIALSAPSVTGDDEDGLLTMGEIMELKLNADWVVLSACNTAAAQGAGAEAVSGLGRAFFYAGTRAILASMWPVETTSAKELTIGIFRHQKENPEMPRSRAHQKSMLELIEAKGIKDENGAIVSSYAHPFFWAPFIIVGDNGIAHVN